MPRGDSAIDLIRPCCHPLSAQAAVGAAAHLVAGVDLHDGPQRVQIPHKDLAIAGARVEQVAIAQQRKDRVRVAAQALQQLALVDRLHANRIAGGDAQLERQQRWERRALSRGVLCCCRRWWREWGRAGRGTAQRAARRARPSHRPTDLGRQRTPCRLCALAQHKANASTYHLSQWSSPHRCVPCIHAPICPEQPLLKKRNLKSSYLCPETNESIGVADKHVHIFHKHRHHTCDRASV